MSLTRSRFIALAQVGLAILGLAGYFAADKDTLAGWILPVMLAAFVVSLGCLASSYISTLEARLREVMQMPILAWGIVLGLLLLWGRLLWATNIEYLPSLWTYLPFAFLWAWLAIGFLLVIGGQSKVRTFAVFVGRVVIMLSITLVMLEVMLNIFVTQLPEELVERAPLLSVANESRDLALKMPPQAPIRRYEWAGKTYQYTLENDDGDLYRLTCLEPPATQALYDVDIHYTDLGFRETTSGDVDMVVIGDSFTFGFFFNEPYWMNIYPDVLSMGVTGSGSQEQALLLEAFGAERHPDVVLMAYFEGNDLQDTWNFNRARERYDLHEPALTKLEQYNNFRPLRFLSTYSAGLWLIDEIDVLNEVAYGDCPYPVTDDYGNQLTFYDKYVSMMTVDTDLLRESDIYAETREAILSAKAQTEAMNATFVLMFIPDKFHVHYAGLLDQMPILADHFDAFRISGKGFTPDPTITTPSTKTDLIAANLENQRTLLTELAAENDFLFLDLTPALEQAATEGFAAYGDADTHWDQEGNDFVRGVIQDFLREHGLLG